MNRESSGRTPNGLVVTDATTPTKYVASLLRAAVAKHQAGDVAEAESLYRRLLDIAPDNADALHHIGLLRQQRGDLEEAILLLTRAVASRPNHAVCYNNLANMLKEQGRLAEAISAYQAAVRCKPDYANAYFNLADLLLDQAELQAAVECYRQVLRLLPEDAEAWNGLGAALRQQGHLHEAMEAYNKALQIRPDYPDAHNNLGLALAALGDLEAARACYRKAIEFDAEYTQAYENLAKSRRYGPADGDEIGHLQALVDNPDLSASTQISLHFALGKMLDDCGAFEEAFGHYQQANVLKRKTADFDGGRYVTEISQTISTFSSNFFEQRHGSGHQSELPVFIVGMPRSGTTLIEQIIATHPKAFGADELPHVQAITKTLPARLHTETTYPACVAMVDKQLSYSLAEGYLEKLHAIGGNAQRVSDKMPSNFLYLGLIALLFPRARIIHCRRHPMDVCLSIYFRRFTHGYDYTYDLADIATYYRQYQRLMQHWQAVLPLEICDVQYEVLVANQESESRRLIDYCGLSWDDRCLEYHKNTRPVQTMSNWQVRQPIYTDSIHRWKNYDAHLDELKSALGEEPNISA